MTDPTEAETLTDARRDLLSSLTGNTARPSTWESAVMDVFEEVARATEREKVRALLTNALETLDEYHASNTPAWIDIAAWLARDEVPE